MSKIKLTGESSGYVEISAGENAANNTLELPTSGTKIVASDSSNNVNGLGIVTATSFSGDGSALTGIDATSLKDSGDTIRVQANTSGAVVTGVLTATSFSGDGSALTGLASDAITEGNTSAEVVDTGSDGHFKVITEGGEALRVTATKRIGLGTASPATDLHISGSGNRYLRLQSTTLGTATLGTQSSAYGVISGGDVFLETTGAPLTLLSDGASGTIKFGTGSAASERMRINSSGDIGINGTTNPNYHLTFANTSSRNAGIDYTSGSDDTNLDIISAGPSGGWKGRIRFFTSWSGTATEGMRLDENRNLQFNSGYGSVATAYGCRAWGNYVCVGGSPGDRGSGNFSSLQDLGTGDFRFYFTNNMPDANYCVVATAGSSDGSTILVGACPHYGENLTTRIRVITRNSSFTNTDAEWLHIAVFR